MLNKPENWESIEGKERGEYANLPAGAYKCIISDAEVKASKKGEQMLVLYLDIADGLYQGYFADLPKWRSAFYQITVGDGEVYFKGLINAIEDSNASYRFDFNEKTLIGKYCCGVFGREQYLKKDGTLDFSVKVFRVTSLAKMAEGIQTPKDRLLKLDATIASGEGIDINEDDLPF